MNSKLDECLLQCLINVFSLEHVTFYLWPMCDCVVMWWPITHHLTQSWPVLHSLSISVCLRLFGGRPAIHSMAAAANSYPHSTTTTTTATTTTSTTTRNDHVLLLMLCAWTMSVMACVWHLMCLSLVLVAVNCRSMEEGVEEEEKRNP